MQVVLLSLLLVSDVAGDSMRSAVIARYQNSGRLFSPGPTATLMPRFVYVRDTGLELPLPPWQTDAAYAEAFEIARRGFHATQPADKARALMVFTSFDEGGQNLFYVPLANDVFGLGDTLASQIFDDSPGTALDGYIWMGDLDRLEEAGDSYFREAFLHEIAHRWGSYAAVSHADLLRDALRGRQSTHWSFLVDREKSPMDGNDWVAEGSSMVTAFSDPVEFAFSPVDLYFMGVLPPEAVAPFVTITGFSGVSPPWLMVAPDTPPAHRTGAPVTLSNATTVEVSIEDIIDASGARIPAAIDQRITWPIGIVLLSNGFATPTLADLQLLDRRILELAQEFEKASSGRVVLDVDILGAGMRPPGSACTSVDECDQTLSDACMAPPDEDPICTRTCQTGAVCALSQCCLEGFCVPSRYCGVVTSPTDDGGAQGPVSPGPGGGLVLDGDQGCSCTASSSSGTVWILLLGLSRAIRARCKRRR